MGAGRNSRSSPDQSPKRERGAIPGYEIEGELGRGGMGQVYQARELATKRTVALKVMLAGRYADERHRRRFEREVELAAALEHPHIARIYASGLHEGHHWFAMEYVEGTPLDSYVEREQLSLPELLGLFARICHAVNHAHQRGIMHRDLKPGNILVDERNQPHVLDFGLAKLLERPAAPVAAGLRTGRGMTGWKPVPQDVAAGAPAGRSDVPAGVPPAAESEPGASATGQEPAESISLPGEVAGTPAYMSPEQTKGDPSQIDIRSDVYSLGVILYRLLTGQGPYGQTTGIGELLRAISEVEPKSPRQIRKDIRDEVSAIVLRALRKDPAERYQTAGELGRDLEAHLSGDPVTAKQGSGWYALRKLAGRYKGAAAVVAAVVVLSVGLGLTFGTLWTTTRIELKEVTKERTVYRDRLIQAGLDPSAPIAQSLETDLTEARERISRLREEARSRSEQLRLVNAETDGLRAELDRATGWNPPPPNPADPVNYVEWINNTFGLENAADDLVEVDMVFDRGERAGAWFEGLDRALHRAAAGPWSGDDELADWLSRWEPAWAKYREGARKSRCWIPASVTWHPAYYDSPHGEDRRKGDEERLAEEPRKRDMLSNCVLPGLSRLKMASKALLAEGWQAWQAGDEDILFENVLTVLRVAHHLEGEATLIERLVGVDCATWAYAALVKGLALSRDPGGRGRRIKPALGAADPASPDLLKDVRMERLVHWDVCQRVFLPTDRRGVWAIDKPTLDHLMATCIDGARARALGASEKELARVGFEATLRAFNEYGDAIEEWARTPYVEAGPKLDEARRGVSQSGNPLLRASAFDWSVPRRRHESRVAQRRATHLIVHLFAYHAEHHRFPRALRSLEAPDLAELRVDPFSGKDFVYKPTADSFTLYSVADNLEDDTGQHDPKWDNGDFVFWPIQVRGHRLEFRTAEPAPPDFDAWTFSCTGGFYTAAGARVERIILEPSGKEHRRDVVGAGRYHGPWRSDFSDSGDYAVDPRVFRGQHITVAYEVSKGRVRFGPGAQFSFRFYRRPWDRERPFLTIPAIVEPKGLVTPDGRIVYPPWPNPAEPVNYIAWVNEEMAKGLTENAADNLLEIHVLMRNGPQVPTPDAFDTTALDGPWSGNPELSRFLESFQPALVEFRAAARKSQCFFPWWTQFPSWYLGLPEDEPYDPDPFDLDDDPRMKDWSIRVLLPSLSLARACGKALIVEGWQAWAKGDQRLLPANALLILECASHHEHQYVLISKLVGVAMAHLAYEALVDALAESDDAGALASRFAAELAAADPTPPSVSRQFRGEHLLWCRDACQRVFMPGPRPGSWQVYAPMYRKLAEATQQIGKPPAPEVTAAEIEKLTDIGFDETLREIDRHFDAMVAWSETPYYQAAQGCQEIEKAIKGSDNPLVFRLLPSLSRARLLCERRLARRRATHLLYRLFVHRAKTGGFPTGLRWLDAPDLDELRIDPFSGKDFVYKRKGRRFTLYSVADNLKDDGGRHDPKWEDGDFVFWPVQK